MDKLRALVIDDSPEILEFIEEQVLKPCGFEVEVALDGVEGLHKATAASPDVIIMDFEMPKLTGLQVLREIRRRGNNVPVILMTSHRSEQIAIDIFHLSVHDYIMKPFTPEQMQEAIDSALSVTHLQRDKEELECQLKKLNEQQEQNLHDLNALYYISKSLASMVHPAKFLERIVDTVLFVTRSEECILALIDPQMGQLKGHLIKRRSPDPEPPPPPPPDELIVHATIRDGSSKTPTESILSVPLQVGQTVVGTLTITKQVSGQFTWQDDRLLRILADYAAIAVYNAQVMRQLRRSKGKSAVSR